jgi:replication factor A1
MVLLIVFSICFKYKVCFTGADDTYSLQFMFFEKKGVELIGKSSETLRKRYDPSSIPPEISKWITHKCTFIVKVLFKKSVKNMEPSFEVVMIKERHGKQATLSNIIHNVSNYDLPPLVTISSKRKIEQVQQRRIYCLLLVLLNIFMLTMDLLHASLLYTPQFTDIQDMDLDQQSE